MIWLIQMIITSHQELSLHIHSTHKWFYYPYYVGSAQESIWTENIVKSNRDEIWKMILLMIKLIGNRNMHIQRLLESFISIG